MDEGHCGLPTDQLISLAEELLEAPKELILTALEVERSVGAVIADKVDETACIFLEGLYGAEQAIAERLIRIGRGRLPAGMRGYVALFEVSAPLGILAAGLLGAWVVPEFGWRWMFVIGAIPALLVFPIAKATSGISALPDADE